jgi:hypothetical protein
VYATVDGHRSRLTVPIESSAFRQALSELYYRRHQVGLSSAQAQLIIDTCAGRALHDGRVEEVYVRHGSFRGRIYIDLAEGSNAAIRIDRDGWRIVPQTQVKFHRPGSTLALPRPSDDGDLSLLRAFLNVDDDDFTAAVGWLVGALNPHGPYLILLVHGEQGSAKSTCCSLLQYLLDPSTPLLRAPPRSNQDLMIAAKNRRVLTFDNISYLQPWLSDSLCRVATGAGFATRALYTDADEAVIGVTRPLILNGISEFGNRGDLVDRALPIFCSSIADADRVPEAELRAEFELARPRILGGLLDAVAEAMRNLDKLDFQQLPRMADAARWITAAEPALPWPKGQFLEVYQQKRATAADVVLDANPIGRLVLQLGHNGGFQGTAQQLLKRLHELADVPTTFHKNWPKDASALSRNITRIAPDLRARGVEADRTQTAGAGSTKRITIRAIAEEARPAGPTKRKR